MADSPLEAAMDPAVLNASWRRLRSEHTPWMPGVSRDECERDLVRHLFELREDVLAGKYRPCPLRQFPLKKPDGRRRIISAQYLRDKLIQRALLTVLEPRAERLFHDDSYAYRPRRGVHQALARSRERIRCGLDWLVDADIHQFFDSIPHPPLRKTLKRWIRDRRTMAVIDLWLKQGAHHTSLLGTRRGISQGAILSPLFCNLYLHDFDTALARANIPFVRYADDFLLFTATKRDAQKALAHAEKALRKLDLRLHPKKTRIVRSGPSVQFLGKPLPRPSR